jgi:hypothetical protein
METRMLIRVMKVRLNIMFGVASAGPYDPRGPSSAGIHLE